MKLRNGMPTMKELGELVDRIGLRIHPLSDTLKYTRSIVYRGDYQIEKANIVNDELSKFFETEHRPAKSYLALTGSIKIIKQKSL